MVPLRGRVRRPYPPTVCNRSGLMEPPCILIVGPPRSGTTLLLNLLRGHPGVVHANAGALGIPTSSPQSLESSILDPAKGLSDFAIVEAFGRLRRANPDKAIVEKTPVHIFHLERARRLLRPRILCTVRDPLDVVASLLAVGRNPNAWWKKAPKTLEAAANLTRRYLEASIHNLGKPDVTPVDYASLYADTRQCLMTIHRRIGISSEFLDAQLDFARSRENVPFEGVWANGVPGAGLRDLAPSDRARAQQVIGTDLLDQLGFGLGA